MKNVIKITLSILLCAALLSGYFSLLSASANNISVGSIITFGSYPKSLVTDTDLIDILTKAEGRWVSYKYLDSGQPSDYMLYKDVIHNGVKYRAVKIDKYRPDAVNAPCPDYNCDQQFNNYFNGNTYWFRYDPLTWRVLDPQKGLVLCTNMIDSQPFNNHLIAGGLDVNKWKLYFGDEAQTFYANSYAHSSLRSWLNDDFLNTAFSDKQKSLIRTELLPTKAFDPEYSHYDSTSIRDKVFILSYQEALNEAYGFKADGSPSELLYASITDYAQSQGLGLRTFLLRSAYCYSNTVCGVDNNDNIAVDTRLGAVGTCMWVDSIRYGITPAIMLKDLKDDPSGSIIGKEKISISNFTDSRTEAYKTTITFNANTANTSAGLAVHWLINGTDKSISGSKSYTVKNAVEDFTVQARLIDRSGNIVAESAKETVIIKNGFFDRFIAFFREILKKLPVINQ